MKMVDEITTQLLEGLLDSAGIQMHKGFQIVRMQELFPSGRWQAELDVKRQGLGYGENRLGQRRVRKHLSNFKAG